MTQLRAPWGCSAAPALGRTGVLNVPSAEGEALGRELARLTKPCLAEDRRLSPKARGPCDECAFVQGTVPNRCLTTIGDALKCVIEGEPFYCHKGVTDGERPSRLCAGFVAALGSSRS